MAITFDDATGANSVGASATSLTYSKTCTGSNLFLLVAVDPGGASSLVSGITYSGVSMTKLADQVIGSSLQSIWGLQGPATGANNIIISFTGSLQARSVAASYAGVKQTITVDNSGSSSNSTPDPNTSMTLSITSVADNCWMISSGGIQRNPTAGTGSTFRTSAGSETQFRLFDSNGVIHPAGANSMQITYTSIGADSMGMSGVTLAPASATNTNFLMMFQ